MVIVVILEAVQIPQQLTIIQMHVLMMVSCIAVALGCTDSSMFNYDSSANTDDGSCITYIYGCTDSSMFNYDSSS